MIILGHDIIKSEPLYFVKKSEDIINTPPNSIVLFEFSEQNLKLCEHCSDEDVSFAIIADVVKDVLFSSSLGASFIICDKKLAPKAQKLADEYMFDAKILLYGSNETDLEWAADLGIDGILFEKGIDYGSC
jgi:hypothetical protein